MYVRVVNTSPFSAPTKVNPSSKATLRFADTIPGLSASETSRVTVSPGVPVTDEIERGDTACVSETSTVEFADKTTAFKSLSITSPLSLEMVILYISPISASSDILKFKDKILPILISLSSISKPVQAN